MSVLEARAVNLQCNGVNVGKATELANEVVSAAQIK